MEKRTQNEEPPKEEVCQNCKHSRPLNGLGAAVLICSRKKTALRQWWAVEAGASCVNYKRALELVPPELAAALAEGAKLIPLTQDKFAIVDAEDYDRLNKYKWHAQKDRRNYYAKRRRSYGMVLMHRVILNAPAGLVVDHINHNGLDNRKANLRLCTAAQNSQNSRPCIRPNQWSKYKGVTFHKHKKRFTAFIRHNKKKYFLGYFKNEIDAAKAYDKAAKKYFGEYAYLNFPKENSEAKRKRTPNIEHRTPNVECGNLS